MYFFVTMVKRLPKQRPLIIDCDASINSKREHRPGALVKSLPPEREDFAKILPPPGKKTWKKPHPGENFLPFSIQ